MIAIETLTRADAALAARIDAVADAVSGIGSLTAAARERLTQALEAARARLAGELAAIAAGVDVLADGILTSVGCDLLALPAPSPDSDVSSVPDGHAPACDDCGAAVPPDRANATGPQRCAACDASLDVAPVNRVAAALSVEAALADPAGMVAGMTETSATVHANGKAKSKRRR